jgi:hypothetical protein
MENAKILKYSDMKIALRKDFYGFFREALKDFFEESGCTYFGHNVIKNYRKKGHVISTFSSDEKWHEIYWDKYYNTDPLERMINRKALDNFSLMSLNLAPTSECTEARMSLSPIKEGLNIALNHKNETIENMTFGWKSFNVNDFTIEKISKLCNILKPMRNFHLEKGLEILT